MSSTRFTYTIFIRTTAEKLWHALTNPAITEQYWYETRQISLWQVGSEWQLRLKDGRLGDSGVVVEIEPPRLLKLSWRHELFAEFVAEGYSSMSYVLEPRAGAVKLDLIHEIGHENSRLIETLGQGWPLVLSSLKRLLETGAPLDETRVWPKHI